MTFVFRPAIRSKTHLIVAIAGCSGSGKTLSSLKLARGLVGGDDSKIFVIDTEAGRALHYACATGEKPGPFRFAFQYAELGPPFTPARYAEAIQAAVAAGAGVIMVDSASGEHEGIGGILEMHDAALTRMAGNDYAKREKMTFSAWIEPKAAHNKFVNILLQQKAHIILCFRAKDKLKMVKNERGRMEPVQMGWTAICADRLEYEATCLLMLPPNAKGVPDLAAPETKLQEAHRALFPAGKAIDESAGKALAEWARGAEPPLPTAKGDRFYRQTPETFAKEQDLEDSAPSVSQPEGPGSAASDDGYDAERVVHALWEGAEAETAPAALREYVAIQRPLLDVLKAKDPTRYAGLTAKISQRMRDLKTRPAA